MAEVHEYIIITQGRNTYRSDGVTHVNAMRNFVANPQIKCGFHEGDYTTDDGEKFIVIGPGEDGPMTTIELVAEHHTMTCFVTEREQNRQASVRVKIEEAISERKTDDEVELIVSENLRTPPYDLTTTGEVEIRENGVRINNVTVPWAYVLNLVEVEA